MKFRFIYDNEDSYEGEWYKDQRYGYGTLKDNNSDIYLGIISPNILKRLLVVRLNEWMWSSS